MRIIMEAEFVGKSKGSGRLRTEIAILVAEKVFRKDSLANLILRAHSYINARYEKIMVIHIRISWKLTFLSNLNRKWYVNARDRRLEQIKKQSYV